MFKKEINLFLNNYIKLSYVGENKIILFDLTANKMFEKYLTKVIRWNEVDSKETSFSFAEKPQEKYYISFDDFYLTLEFPSEEELFYFELKYV